MRFALAAYASGAFPMADSRGAETFHWYTAPVRSLLPIEALHVSRRLRKLIRQAPFDISIDRDFAGVIDGCAEPGPGRQETWINRGIRALMLDLHKAGFAHSIECRKDGLLAGGLYGMALGAVFCGESMFSRERDAGKVALVHLCARLQAGGFRLFDTQFMNPHLRQFGAYEMPHDEYIAQLHDLLHENADFTLAGSPLEDAQALVEPYLARTA